MLLWPLRFGHRSRILVRAGCWPARHGTGWHRLHGQRKPLALLVLRLAPERRQSWETTEDFTRRYGHRDFLGGETVVVLFSGRVFGCALALALGATPLKLRR